MRKEGPTATKAIIIIITVVRIPNLSRYYKLNKLC